MKLLDRIVQGVDAASTLPGKIQRRADELNDRIIRVARKVQSAADEAGSRVETNLTKNKIRGLGGDVADWLSVPRNLVITAASAIIVIFLIRKI